MSAERPGISPLQSRIPFRVRRILSWIALAAIVIVVWFFVGRDLWRDYKITREEERAAEDSTPIGYVGLHYRRTYNNRPSRFIVEREGRRLLWAAMDDKNLPTIYFDITGAAFDPTLNLSGGFGMDSIVGIDYPIFQGVDTTLGRHFPPRKEVFGMESGDGPRAFPLDLLLKAEVVNDEETGVPFAVVVSRGTGRAETYTRILDGRSLSLGTTGYQSEVRPLLYDRRTRSLWLPGKDQLDCVAGPLQGKSLPTYKPLVKTTWAAWTGDHPRTSVLVGTDREPPIPAE
ncbi:DUF3179 domain-containing (seleno)protein [Isosphaeraceae bacterium EP7]